MILNNGFIKIFLSVLLELFPKFLLIIDGEPSKNQPSKVIIIIS